MSDLPPAVVDRAKGVTLQALSSALVARDMPASRQALALMQEEEAGGGGIASVLCNGGKLTKGGAAFVNAEMIFAGGKWDTFRMLTHPGIAILPAALAAAETTGCSGDGFLTGVAAAYEVMERMAAEFIPTVMSRGFHAGPVFGIFGAAVAAAKIQGLDADQVNAQSRNASTWRPAIWKARAAAGARCARAARSATPCSPWRWRGTERRAAKQHWKAMPASITPMPATTWACCATATPAHNRTELGRITEGLGRDWIFLETLYRIYSTAGYNIAHVDVTARLCEEHNLTYQDIDRIEAVVNWLETEYPSPAFPTPGSDGQPKVGSTQYFTAYGAVTRGYPLLRGGQPGPGETDPPEVLDLMHRVKLIPMVRRTLFGPRITVFTKDGRSFTREGTGREFIWDFEEQARRIRPIAPGLAISDARFAELIDTCRNIERIDRAAERLISLTISKKTAVIASEAKQPRGTRFARRNDRCALYCRSNFTTRRTRPHSPGWTT